MRKLFCVLFAMASAAVMLTLSGCGKVSANTGETGAAGQSAFDIWRLNYEGDDLDGVAGLTVYDYMIYMEGNDGVAPVIDIDENGYWIIDGVNTFVQARGGEGTVGATPKIYFGEADGLNYMWIDSNNNGEQDVDEKSIPFIPMAEAYQYYLTHYEQAMENLAKMEEYITELEQRIADLEKQFPAEEPTE